MATVAHSPFYSTSARLLTAIQTTSIVISLSFYAIALCFAAFAEQGTSDKEENPKPKPISKSRRRLQIFQLGSVTAIFLLCLTHATLLATEISNLYQTDIVFVATLFYSLTWLILLLGLIDSDGDAGFPQHGTWSIICFFDILNLIATATRARSWNRSTNVVEIVLLTIRLVLLFGLLFGGFLGKRQPLTLTGATEDETCPLLDPEVRQGDQEVDKNKKHDDDEDDEEEEEDEDEDEDEEDMKEELKALRKRSWIQYLATFKLFLPHLRPKQPSQYGYLGIVCLCTLLERFMNVLTPLTLGMVVNKLESDRSIPWRELSMYLALYFLSASSGISVIRTVANNKVSNEMKLSLDVFCYSHVMNLSADFHDAKGTARLSSILDRGDTVVYLFEEVVFEFLPMMADLFISVAVLLWLFGAYLCVIVATTIVVFIWSNKRLVKKKQAMRRSWINKYIAAYQQVWESQYNWATVCHFNQVEYEKQQYDKKSHACNDSALAQEWFNSKSNCSRQLIVTFGFLGACLIAVSQIVHGDRRVGDFVMLITYWSQVMSPVKSLISNINMISQRLVDAEKLLIVLEKKPTVQQASNAKELDFQGGSVDFEDVSFSYDGERTVTENISFHAEAGQTIALVGETGGGKSTILKLLFRFYDPTKGRILIDGQDIRGLTMDSFRSLIGTVPQDPAMFERSVLDNVRYADMSASEEEVIEACKAASLHDKVMTFSKGYKQKVGERGTKLSGGEAQRLAIARAVLKKPKMLLLDEATSSVDSVTEASIHACLKQLCKGRTTFIIAHRLSTILHADQILVIKGGNLNEAGPHKDLIKRNGAYRELWNAQLKLQGASPDKSDSKDGEERSDTDKPMTFLNDLSAGELDKLLLLNDADDAQSKDKTQIQSSDHSQQQQELVDIKDHTRLETSRSDGLCEQCGRQAVVGSSAQSTIIDINDDGDDDKKDNKDRARDE